MRHPAEIESMELREDYVARARALAPEVEANAALIEQDRRLPPALVAKLVDAGLFHMLLPRSLGGGEVDPGTFARVILEIARADASTAWCLCQASGCSPITVNTRGAS
jgi:alkylation response protein AidB-like acyl-CoA dehydrogenase